MANRNMSFDDAGNKKGVDVKQTKMLEPGAREQYATGTNVLKRKTSTHKPFGKLGVKGFAQN